MPSRTRNKTPQGSYTVAVHLTELGDACQAFPDAVVDAALPKIGMAMKTIALDEAARATGGDGRLSRFRKGKGVKLTAGYDNVGPTTVRLTPRPLGPWTLVESGSNRSFWFEPRAPRRKGKRKGKPIKLRNGGVRWYVRHGPVRGKHVWTKTRRRIVDDLPDLVHEAIVKAWAEVA